MSTAYAFSFYKSALLTRAEKLRWKHCPNGPPYDPFRIAEALNVKVRHDHLEGIDGYTEYSGTEFRAVIHSGASETRQRFTLAHELGHVLLFRMAQVGLPLNFKRDHLLNDGSFDHQDPSEEALCNEFAAALLMPVLEIRDKVRSNPITPSTVMKVAQSFRVSMHACARQLVKINEMKRIGISYWEIFEGKCAAQVWSTGFSTRISAGQKAVKNSITHAFCNDIEHVTYWQSSRSAKGGQRPGFNIHVQPIPRKHCLMVLTKNSSIGASANVACGNIHVAPAQLMFPFCSSSKLQKT